MRFALPNLSAPAGLTALPAHIPALGGTLHVVGVCLNRIGTQATITITPHPGRRLKTRGSERELPLVGAALEAMRLVLNQRKAGDHFLFPRYAKNGTVMATHASNAVNKWLRRDFDGL